ncbi:hypothetical protein AEGHOMDF_6037 [Methylobacterium soli]|nr:hypothetical protein AEGHOMDF_6037 [Methylobacterium soli]
MRRIVSKSQSLPVKSGVADPEMIWGFVRLRLPTMQAVLFLDPDSLPALGETPSRGRATPGPP